MGHEQGSSDPDNRRSGAADADHDRGRGRHRRRRSGAGGRENSRARGPGPRSPRDGGTRHYRGPREGQERRLSGGSHLPPGERVLVLPGDRIESHGLRPGFGTYRSDGELYASVMGILNPRPPFMRVVPLSGPYIPQKDDLVVGVVQSSGPTYWLLDIRGPHFTPLHMTGTPWKIDYGECGEYLRPGDTVLVRVEGVDESRRVGVTMIGEGLGRLEGGYLHEISPTKVPRAIGKGGSMIQLIQQETRTRLVVGQNGRIWIQGDDEGIRKVCLILDLIDREGQRHGLTERVKQILEEDASRPSPYGDVAVDEVEQGEDRNG